MDLTSVVALLQESLFMLVVFGLMLAYTIARGRQSITNLILGLYLALLISVEFPYYDQLLGSAGDTQARSIMLLVVFVAFAFFSTYLFTRVLPREYDEGKFEGFGKKLLLALGGTILVMIFSYHVLPVTDFVTPGPILNTLFASEQHFFWWLLAPLVVLFFV